MKIIDRIKAWWTVRFHQHAYDIEFIGNGLDYKLVCRCGDTAKDFNEAIIRMSLTNLGKAVQQMGDKKHGLLRVDKESTTVVSLADYATDHLGRKDGRLHQESGSSGHDRIPHIDQRGREADDK
jgi:hypothetical protein